ncbi:hypothetical protein ACHAPU_000699 [Fusarium lateritium]
MTRPKLWQQMAQLQARLPNADDAPNDYILQKFLEDMTSYTQATLDVELGYSDDESTKALSLIEETAGTAISQSGSNDLTLLQSRDHHDPPSHDRSPGLEFNPPERYLAVDNRESMQRHSEETAKTEDPGTYEYKGNFVLDLPVLEEALYPFQDTVHSDCHEFTHSRFTFVTCHPERFASQNYTLRQALLSQPRQIKFVFILQINPSDMSFAKRFNIIHDAMVYAQQKLTELGRPDVVWEQVLVHIHLPNKSTWDNG